jgi:hypothetical protein
MFFGAKRIISTALAAVVFIASINCVCHAAPVAQTAHEHSCCANHGKHDRSNPTPPQHDAKCVHCQRSMMNDTPAAKSLTASFDFCHLAPVDAIHELQSSQTAQRLTPLPPAIASPTLLSLHCALMT